MTREENGKIMSSFRYPYQLPTFLTPW